MALTADQFDINARIVEGAAAAVRARATEHKPFGQTSPENHPYTYYWVLGYNKAVDTMVGDPGDDGGEA